MSTPNTPPPATPPAGDPEPLALKNLSDSIIGKMRAIGGALMKSERPNHTLTPTALVNEAIVKMMSSDSELRFNNRSHLLAAAAMAMRQILVDHARAHNTIKRGGNIKKISWEDVGHAISTTNKLDLLLDINEALEKLQLADERQAQIAEFRLFGGMEQAEIAEVLGVSIETIQKEWRKAKDFLATELAIERKAI